MDTGMSHRLYQLVGERIKQHRKGKLLSQATVAQEVGLTRTSIANIERGHQHVSLYVLYRLSSLLGVEVTAFLPARNELFEKNLGAELGISEPLGDWLGRVMAHGEKTHVSGKEEDQGTS